jgi:hypothetical protein
LKLSNNDLESAAIAEAKDRMVILCDFADTTADCGAVTALFAAPASEPSGTPADGWGNPCQNLLSFSALRAQTDSTMLPGDVAQQERENS